MKLATMKKTIQTIGLYALGLPGFLVGLAMGVLLHVAVWGGFFYLILGLQALLRYVGR